MKNVRLERSYAAAGETSINALSQTADLLKRDFIRDAVRLLRVAGTPLVDLGYAVTGDCIHGGRFRSGEARMNIGSARHRYELVVRVLAVEAGLPFSEVRRPSDGALIIVRRQLRGVETPDMPLVVWSADMDSDQLHQRLLALLAHLK